MFCSVVLAVLFCVVVGAGVLVYKGMKSSLICKIIGPDNLLSQAR